MIRLTIDKLKEWKERPNHKPLIVTGVRQCGKTYLIRQFGGQYFEQVAYFNFDGNQALHSIFQYDFNVLRIVDELGSVVIGKPLLPGKCLVIFDEIQACPRAVQALKYFCEDMPDLHVIAAGSLLGIALREEGFSFPVGKVDRLEMFPMNFEEFVIADGGEHLLKGLKKLDLSREVPELYTIPLQKYLKNYYVVGGMPEAVQTWIDTHDYQAVERVQDRLLRDYSDDFGKHTSPQTANRIKLIWNAIPTQIAKENNKFIFSHIKSGARAKDLEDALEWLVNAGLTYKLDLVSQPELPLSGMADTTYFKVYMADVGLLRRLAKVDYKTILNGDDSFIRFKGAMAENFILTQLKFMGIDCYFWRTKADAEIDFISDYGGSVFPIEVKAADNTRAKSLQLFCKRYSPKIAFKTSLKNVGVNPDGLTMVWSLPLYLIFRLPEYLATV